MAEIFNTKTSGQTQKIACDIARQILKSKPSRKAIVIGLVGDLGSGKTMFAKGFAKSLGIKNTITSPTFVLMRIYALRVARYAHLIHIDAYRIEKTKEISDLGFKNLISHPKNIILIEWADRIKKILPKDSVVINFEHMGGNKRKIILNLK